MRDDIIFYSSSGVIFVIYFKIYRYLWLTFIPENTMTEVLAVCLIIVVLIPLTLISAHKLISTIKSDS